MTARLIRAVAFDVFGTLVRISQRRYPYQTLVRYLEAQGRFASDDHEVMMINAVDLADMPAFLGYQLTTEQQVVLRDDLRVELNSIELFNDALPAIEVVRALGLRTALCSNLAYPYAHAVKTLLPQIDCYVWSFEAGAIKPDPKIYAHLCRALNCRPHEILMVGDTKAADHDGPRMCGIQGWHLSRGRCSTAPHVIHGLDEVPALLNGL